MARRGRIIRGAWAACLIVAALNHASILLRHGLFWTYHGANPASAFYWTALTVVDPLVAMLLFVRPRVGVPATVGLIATNVVHNLAVTAVAIPSAFAAYTLSSPPLMAQLGFLTVVLLTWPAASRDLRRSAHFPTH